MLAMIAFISNGWIGDSRDKEGAKIMEERRKLTYQEVCYMMRACYVPDVDEIVAFFRRVVYVDLPDGCWLWIGTYTWKPFDYKKGWGSTTPTKFIFQLAGGIIPYRQRLVRRCTTKECVNPFHYYVPMQDDPRDFSEPVPNYIDRPWPECQEDLASGKVMPGYLEWRRRQLWGENSTTPTTARTSAL
jgi:hypothetical protein